MNLCIFFLKPERLYALLLLKDDEFDIFTLVLFGISV